MLNGLIPPIYHMAKAFYPVDWGSFWRHVTYVVWQLTDQR
jgi:hypothetical protein